MLFTLFCCLSIHHLCGLNMKIRKKLHEGFVKVSNQYYYYYYIIDM